MSFFFKAQICLTRTGDYHIKEWKQSQITSSSQHYDVDRSDRPCHNHLNSPNSQTQHPPPSVWTGSRWKQLFVWQFHDWMAFLLHVNGAGVTLGLLYYTMYTYFRILMAFSVSFPCSPSRISTLARMNAEAFAFGIFKLQTLCSASPQVVFMACEGVKQRKNFPEAGVVGLLAHDKVVDHEGLFESDTCSLTAKILTTFHCFIHISCILQPEDIPGSVGGRNQRVL